MAGQIKAAYLAHLYLLMLEQPLDGFHL